MLSRAEVGNMTDTALSLAYSRIATRLRLDFDRGAPGRLSDVYDLALLSTDAELRRLQLSPLPFGSQLSFDLDA